uniref:Small nuclear RNA activating complex (SNAPc), subunit SNAP43 protein n=1 Tax=Fagus sylvatica TaxID=28930 RepID=A0A2N9FJ18_FAGSY
MDLSPFKLDIDELIHEFSQGESTALGDMKRVWISRKFSYIYDASPSTNLAFFMQSLYAHSIGYMIGNASLSHRLGGLYCLYCLYETQPFKPPFRIYLSLGELKKITNLVVEAKEKGINVVSALVKRMLEKNMFLFGSVDINEDSVTETVNQLTELQNARIQVAYNKLFANTRMEHFLHMDLGMSHSYPKSKHGKGGAMSCLLVSNDMDSLLNRGLIDQGMEVGLNVIQKMSKEYAEAKKLAIGEASKEVVVEDLKPISEGKEMIGDTLEKTANDWNVQKDIFYRQTGFSQRPPGEQQPLLLLQQEEEQQQPQDDEDFDQELQQLLSEV